MKKNLLFNLHFLFISGWRNEWCLFHFQHCFKRQCGRWQNKMILDHQVLSIFSLFVFLKPFYFLIDWLIDWLSFKNRCVDQNLWNGIDIFETCQRYDWKFWVYFFFFLKFYLIFLYFLFSKKKKKREKEGINE